MRIRIQGADHEIPDVDSFTLDESGLIYDYTSITLDKYFDADPMNPRLHQAWLHILIRRTQPDLSETEIKQLVRDTPHLSIFAPPDRDASAEDGGADSPPDSSHPPTGSNGWHESTDASTPPSGNGGASGGGLSPAPSPPASSGHPRSAPMSPSATSDTSPPGSSTPATT